MYLTEDYYIQKITQLKGLLRAQKPVVQHHNFVPYQCAHITSFIGAAPIMAFAGDETAQVTAKSDALVINTGTLNDKVVSSSFLALVANDAWIPVILRPGGRQIVRLPI